MPRSGSWRLAAPLVLAACGLLLVTSARAADGEDLRGSGHAELSDLVRAADQRHEELSETIEQLNADIERLATSEQTPEEQQLAELHDVAGLTAVEGPGLRVTLSDADLPSGQPAQGFELENYIVHQQDLDAVMNALWAGGAEAMMVMDQRVITTSSIQCIGPVLQLQGRRYAPPYTITAVGDVAGMTSSLDDSHEVAIYRSQAEVIGLGFEMEYGEFRLPAYEGSVGVSTETAA